jgi:hypothetical protein
MIELQPFPLGEFPPKTGRTIFFHCRPNDSPGRVLGVCEV